MDECSNKFNQTMTNKELQKEILSKAIFSREFEKDLYNRIKKGLFKYPIYLSYGQEYIAASLACYIKKYSSLNPNIFIQHRGHSTYLSFGGNLELLIKELLGEKDGCANGMGGSASIQSLAKNIYGHDGMMGSNAPISVGSCFSNKKPTICFLGDAAAEEDYFLPSVGWAVTKDLPILFVIEDNNYSILTEKKVRRNWELSKIASAMNVEAYDIDDNPRLIIKALKNVFKKPLLLNIRTNRYFWHAGAGIDNKNQKTQHDSFSKFFKQSDIEKFEIKYKKKIKKAWDKCLN